MEAQVARIQAGKVVRVDRVPHFRQIMVVRVWGMGSAAIRIGVAVAVAAP
jgi:hypothetical protein